MSLAAGSSLTRDCNHTNVRIFGTIPQTTLYLRDFSLWCLGTFSLMCVCVCDVFNVLYFEEI